MATLLDVWNAGTRLASQGLTMLSEEKKYTQDIDLFNASMELEDRQNNIAKARELVYDDSGINHQGAEGYPENFKEYVNSQLGEWKKQWGDRNTGSRYFQDNLGKIESRGTLALNQTLANAEVVYAKQRINATYENELATIFNNPNWAAEQKRSLALELLDRTKGAAGWDLTTAERAKDAILDWSLKQETQFTAGAGISTEDIKKRYDTMLGEGLTGGNPETGEDAGLYATVRGAKEQIEVARDAAVASQQAYNFRGLQELNTAYTAAVKDYHTAVSSGDPAAVNEAYKEMMNAYRTGKPQQDAALGKGADEYNADNRIQIMAMFGDPPGMPKEKGETGGGTKAGKGISRSDLTNNLVQQFINGFISPEFSMDSRGNLIGFTAGEGGEYYTGLSLSAIYNALDAEAQAQGWDVAPGQLQHEFDQALLKRLGDKAETSEAQRVFSQLTSFTKSQWNDITKGTGQEQDTLERTMMGQILDAYARYSSSSDSAPQKNAILESSLKGIRDQYIGNKLNFLYDDKKTSTATYTRNVQGSLGNLGKALDAYENNPDINLPGRSGGKNIPAHLDDNFKAYTNRAEALAREELGAVDTKIEGGSVIALDRNGNRYRIGGDSTGGIFLYKPNEGGGWTPIAKRRFNWEDNHAWIKTTPGGGRMPNNSYEPFEGL